MKLMMNLAYWPQTYGKMETTIQLMNWMNKVPSFIFSNQFFYNH